MTNVSWYRYYDPELSARGEPDAARGVHGFETAGIHAAQAAVQARLVDPKVPRHPLEDIVGQIRTGRLVPCPAPEDAPPLELSPERIAELTAQDRQESVAEKRARLLAELAELGDENPEDVSAPSPSAGADGADTPTRTRGKAAASR